jgi:tetratricopeptide (TPR) repeat protein
MRLLFCIIVSCLTLAPGVLWAEEADGGETRVDPGRLVGRLRATYLRPASFSAAAMRFPLRKDIMADLRAAREAARNHPTDVEKCWQAAVLAEEADDPDAVREWQTVLGLMEGMLKTRLSDQAFLERRLEAMIGANVGVRAVPAAERLAQANPRSWKVQVLLGDAHLRRADFHWRVVLRLKRDSKEPPQPVLQMNADLAACEKAYNRAVELAPAEPAARGARIALVLARPLMASFLPSAWMTVPEASASSVVRANLIELIERSPGKVAPLWHAAWFFATHPVEGAGMSAGERGALEKGLAEARAEEEDGTFLEEARGLFRCAVNDWSGARKHFEGALALLPERRFAAEWLGLAEARSPEPREPVVARVRARLETRPRAEDWTLLGVLLAEEDRPRAVEALRKALELHRDSANVRFNLGVLLLGGNTGSLEARRHIQQVWEAQPDDQEAAFAFLVVQVLDGQREAARRTLEDLIKQPDLDTDLRSRIQETLKELVS